MRIQPSSLRLDSDPVLLHRVLLNLVSNAVQHAQRDSLLVVCRPLHGQLLARIEVLDSGIGMALTHHEKVFDEFFQIDNPQRDRAKGLGLGLRLVARVCDLLGHRLTLRSGLGCGTRFTVAVPCAPAPPASADAGFAAEQLEITELAGVRVLLIEDDASGSLAL